MGLLPSKPDLSADGDARPRVVGVDSEDADALMSALTSRTARRILSVLHEDPAPPSKLADQVDTSLQNVQYHLERLEGAGAVEVIGTAYSEKGREMDIYAPADEPLVIYAGREEEASGLRAALSRLLSGVFALAVGAVAVQEVFGEGLPFPVARTGSGGGGGDRGESGGSDVGIASDGDAGAPEPTPSPDGPSVAEVTSSPTPAAEATRAPTEAAPTTATPAATGTPAPTGAPPAAATDAAATAAPTADPTPAAKATDLATETVHVVVESGGSGLEPTGLPPGVLFFLGGALVLVAAVALTYGN